MITPTVGRIVWYRKPELDQPLAAIVTFVHGPRLVNLTVFQADGDSRGVNSVRLLQDNDKPVGSPWCEWMPYQKGQAAKTEALEQKLTASA